MKIRRLFVIGALAAMLGSCAGEEKKKDADKADEKPVVEVQTVEAMDVDQEYVYTATTEADKVNNISSSMPLRIKSILVEEGQNVSAGQRVAVLDDVNAASYELQVSTTEASLKNVQADYNRALELFKIGGGTRQAVDQLQAQVVNARNNVANARRALATRVRIVCSPPL